MSGGLTDEEDPFLQSLDFLKGWPIDKLVNNPNNAYISYFKLVWNSCLKQYIYTNEINLEKI